VHYPEAFVELYASNLDKLEPYEDHRGEIDVLVARQMAPGEP